jgi:hypothetical protein
VTVQRIARAMFYIAAAVVIVASAFYFYLGSLS